MIAYPAFVSPWRFTADDVERMAEVGILGEDTAAELVDGEIVRTSPTSPKHASVVSRMVAAFHRMAVDRVHIRSRGPIRLGAYSQTAPDVTLLKRRDDDYMRAHPTAADVLLAVEVADMSLPFDVQVKLPLYARHGIAESWIVDPNAGIVYACVDPTDVGYRTIRAFGAGETLAADAIENLRIKIREFLR